MKTQFFRNKKLNKFQIKDRVIGELKLLNNYRNNYIRCKCGQLMKVINDNHLLSEKHRQRIFELRYQNFYKKPITQ